MFDHPTLRAIADLVQSQMVPDSSAVSAAPEAKVTVRTGLSFLMSLSLCCLGAVIHRP